MEFVLLRTRVQVAALSQAAQELMTKVIPLPDATYTTDYFLARINSRALPRVVTCYDNKVLVGILYTYELRVFGAPTGYAFGGDQLGRNLLLCAPEREREILTASCDFLLKNGLHALRLDWTPHLFLEEGGLHMPGNQTRLKVMPDARAEGDWLQLAPDYEQFLEQLGKHTRRNIRYYRRKTEAAGLRYSGPLQPEEARKAMRSLNHSADYPMEREEVRRDKRFMTTFRTPVIAGLCKEDGAFVSLVTGYTHGPHLHILTQLNGDEEMLRKLSISLVLRGYLIEDFISRGFTAIHFFQGSSPMLGRICSPIDLQHLSIDRHQWLMTPFKDISAAFANYRQHSGKRVPYRVQWAAGSYWPQERPAPLPMETEDEEAVVASSKA